MPVHLIPDLRHTAEPAAQGPFARSAAMRQHATAQHGITLIELLVAVAIVGILAAIAYPSYQGQIVKARRTEGQALLLDAAGRQEQYFANNKTFTDDMTELGYAANPALSENGYYSVAAAAGSTGDIATSFIATATRLGSQTEDTVCYDFTIDSTGRRGMTGFDGDEAPSGCW